MMTSPSTMDERRLLYRIDSLLELSVVYGYRTRIKSNRFRRFTGSSFRLELSWRCSWPFTIRASFL